MNTLRTSWSTIGSIRQHRSVSTNTPSDHVIATGDLVINARSREVIRHGEVVDVTKTEFDLLVIMATHPRQVFTARQLFQFVWSSQYFDADHVIETHISRLRRKLGESGSHPRYIHTVRGVGYRFEPRPEIDALPETPRGRYHVRLAPDLTVADIDPRLAELLGVDGNRCKGESIADLMQGLTATAHLHFTTMPVRDESGILVGIQLEVTPMESL
jgi:DNA-binding winged helix-turn-helix (wHTH) protein